MKQDVQAHLPEDDSIVRFISHLRDTHEDTYSIFPTQDWWYLLPRDDTFQRSQGWKLHLPALPINAISLLEAVAPLLIEQRLQWKVLLTLDHLIRFSSPLSALPQLGKFLTIYPKSDDLAVGLAALLHEKTRQFSGPLIPSDFRYAAGSQVYYRYGGFTKQFFYQPSTSLRTLCLLTPNGNKIPDERTTSPRTPEWVSNPFPQTDQTSHVAPNGLFGRGLKVRGVLSQSIKGGVYVVADGTMTCILKEARFGTCPDMFGRDARDRLANEFTILKKIAPLNIAPQPLDLFDAENNRYLLMEHLPGLSLRNYIGQSNYLANAQLQDIRRICDSLIDVVKQCHTHGIVLRDLSPNNVLVTSVGCRFIDLELAHLLSSEDRPFTGATPGYVPLGEEAEVRDKYSYDFYALGALLCFTITGVHPYLSKTEDMLSRLSELLTPDTFLRDSSLTDLAALAEHLLTSRELPLSVPSRSASRGAETRVVHREDSLPFSREELLHHAVTIANYFSEQANWEDSDQLWSFLSPRGVLFHPASFYGGATGIAYFLCEVAQVTHNPTYYTSASRIINWVLTYHPFLPGETPLGLYFGYAGVPWICTLLAKGLEENRHLESATRIADRLAQVSPARLDITHGAAGIGLMHLKLFRETGDSRYLEYALHVGHILLDRIEYDTKGGATWKENLPDGPRHLWGFAHGSAGMAYYLLALYSQTHDPVLKEVLERVHADLRRAEVPTAQDRGCSWLRDSADTNVSWTHWCNGASGVGTYLLTAASYFRDPELKEIALKAAHAIRFSTGMMTSCQCHGLAGDGEYLLQAGRTLNHPEITQAAYQMARKLYTFRLTTDTTPGFIWNSETRDADPAYMTGYCGIYGFFLRLFYEDLPRPFYLTIQ